MVLCLVVVGQRPNRSTTARRPGCGKGAAKRSDTTRQVNKLTAWRGPRSMAGSNGNQLRPWPNPQGTEGSFAGGNSSPPPFNDW